MAETEEKSFDEITSRLDEIVDEVRAKDSSLEHSLDLFDEAIKLGNAAVEMVDNIDFESEDDETNAEEASVEEGPASKPAETNDPSEVDDALVTSASNSQDTAPENLA